MKYIIANWKMNMNLNDVNKWLKEFDTLVKPTQSKIIIAPSFVHIPFVKLFAEKHESIHVAAQNVSLNDKGTHTGEIGLFQLEDFCDFCLVGHSELKEDKSVTLDKAKKCIDNGIIPIVCSTAPLVDLNNMNEGYLIAWEDPKYISRGGVYNEKPIEDIQREASKIGDVFSNFLMYGGSVNEENSAKLAKIDKLHGVLVGNASLNPQTFWKIIKDFE